MEAETEKRIVQIVQEMSSQGMSTKDIKDNLLQMGINKEDISNIMSNTDQKVNVSDVHEKIASVQDSLDTGIHLEPVIQRMDESKEDMERLHSSMTELHEKHAETSETMRELKLMKEEIAEIKQLILEIKPLLSSIERLNKSLLDLNRRMLIK